MMYLVAVILPPLALLLCGKRIQAVISLGLFIVTCLTIVIGIGLIPGILNLAWAIFVVHGHNQRKRDEALVTGITKATSRQNEDRS